MYFSTSRVTFDLSKVYVLEVETTFRTKSFIIFLYDPLSIRRLLYALKLEYKIGKYQLFDIRWLNTFCTHGLIASLAVSITALWKSFLFLNVFFSWFFDFFDSFLLFLGLGGGVSGEEGLGEGLGEGFRAKTLLAPASDTKIRFIWNNYTNLYDFYI